MYLSHLPRKFCKAIGMDRAIGASTATQFLRFVTGPVTMFLIIRFLTPEEQGFMYSFGGVIGLQVFLEAGFAQSIIQFSSKEFAFLRFNKRGILKGKSTALSRLRSIFHKANRFYTITAALLTLGLAVGGYFFFSSQDAHGVPWLIPWLVATLCAGFTFLLTPFWAILEGCNRVAEVAVYRLWATLVGFSSSAIGLSLGLGIHTVIVTSVSSLLFAIGYLILRWGGIVRQILRPAGHDQVSWGGEIWGFQWRIGGTWMSRYFLQAGIAPLAFHLGGAIFAGQIGMTFQIIRQIGGIANSWTACKIPIWGTLAAQCRWKEIDASWSAAAKRNVMFGGTALLAFIPGLLILQWIWPDAASRFLPTLQTSGFVFGWILYSFWLVSMHYTRALRREPFTFLHLAVGIAFLTSCFLLNPYWGNYTIPTLFALVHLPAAFIAIRVRRTIRLESMAQLPFISQIQK